MSESLTNHKHNLNISLGWKDFYANRKWNRADKVLFQEQFLMMCSEKIDVNNPNVRMSYFSQILRGKRIASEEAQEWAKSYLRSKIKYPKKDELNRNNETV